MTNTNVFERLESMVEILGAETLLDALTRALSVDALADNLEYISRCFDLDYIEE